MNNRIPSLLIGVIGILIIAVLALGIDRVTRMTEADLIATVEQKIALAGTDENIVETVDAQGVQILTQVAEFYPSNTPTSTPTSTNTPIPTEIPTITAMSSLTYEDTVTNTASTPARLTQSRRVSGGFGSSILDLSPDNESVAIGYYYNGVNIISLDSGKTMQILTGSVDALWTIAWSPDGGYLAAGGFNEELYVWDIETGELIANAPVAGLVNSLAWSSDSQYIAIGTLENLYVWKLSGQEITAQEDITGHSVAWSSDSNILLVSGRSGLYKYQINSGETGSGLKISDASVTARVAISPNNQLFAFADNSVLRIHGMETYDALWQVNTINERPESLFWSPDGQYISIVTGTELNIWNVDEQELMYTIPFDSVTYSRSGAWTIDGQEIIIDDINIFAWRVPDELNVSSALAQPTPSLEP